MPHRDLIYEIKLPIGINLQYLLSLIPILGFFVSIITCIKNIRKIQRAAVFSWWIQSFLLIVMYCLLCALCIWIFAILLTENTVVFAIMSAFVTYISIVGISFVMIHVEKKVVIKELTNAASKSDGEQEVE